MYKSLDDDEEVPHVCVCACVFSIYIYMLYDIYNIRDLKLMLTICPHIFQRFKS